ncbi:TPA: hypothetical protein DCY43_03695 [candidate division WWE3 bacterium]|uniref:Uncharacterized protein n=3 Tax=Katanobacteria TaxID=422282 RepID=A0A0G1KKD0_UNCKA|nr:MAG: hypothetical protein UW82_C0029G0020 [candidate division WWE3 bacterium GW2011_GWC2_44_9]OGC52303.1 MAG: hypothetical protein A2709_00640 [candidate division WWE3 bacterium RIFCSPHIGHO2_01_FULL_43_9]HAZ29814.1 hypothetical protein [candidate division WWE3 bacterium]
MTDFNIKEARQLIKDKPYLMWSTKSYDELSPQSILESVINYGDWPDFERLIAIFGLKQSSELFKDIKNKRRTNLRPKTVNYFTKYFEKHA